LKQFKSACRKYHIAQAHINEAQADSEARKFIEIDAERGKVNYRSEESVGAELNTTVGIPVKIDIGNLRKRKFKPALYAAWIAAGKDGALMMSRARISYLTGLSDETQRRYEHVAGVQVTANIGYAPESLVQQEVDSSTCLVPADDRDEKLGNRYFYKRRGDKENLYWRTVNTYKVDDAAYRRAPTGNSRKVNRRLRAAVIGEAVPQRVFFQGRLAEVRGFEAGHCYRLQGGQITDVYCWRSSQSGERKQRIVSARVWKYEIKRPNSRPSREQFS
jgi:hypothetical protein